MSQNLKRHIKQTQPFKNEYIEAMIGLFYLSYQLSSTQQDSFKPFGITTQQYNVLRILRGQFPKATNIGMIKERMLDKMCDASRIVDRLMKLNLVVKAPNLIDKRNSDVTITEQALKLLEQLDKEDIITKTPICNLNEEEIKQLNCLIDKALDY